jgi:hypothetical protein
MLAGGDHIACHERLSPICPIIERGVHGERDTERSAEIVEIDPLFLGHVARPVQEPARLIELAFVELISVNTVGAVTAFDA